MRNSLLARTFIVALVLTIVGCGGKSSTTPSSESNNSANAPNSSAPATPTPPPAPPAPPPPIVVPDGTVLTVTLDQTLNTKVANNDDSFSASLAGPVTVDAATVLPAGTKVIGTVVTAQSAGKFKGNALLQLTLDSINFNGTRYSI